MKQMTNSIKFGSGTGLNFNSGLNTLAGKHPILPNLNSEE
jgi:hypothetical protein